MLRVTSRAGGAESPEWARRGLRLAGDNSSNTHTTQGSGWRGSQQHLHQQINTLHARRPDRLSASAGNGAMAARAARGGRGPRAKI